MLKLWTVAFGTALITVVTFPAQAQSLGELTSAISPNQLCIQPEGGLGAWNGAVIRLVPCSPYDDSYFWYTRWAGDFDGRRWFYIINNEHRDSRLCLDLTDGNTANGTPLQLWQCTTSTTMMWAFDGNGKIVNARSRKCMDVRAGSDAPGTVIQNYRCANLPDGSANLAQIWRSRDQF